MKLSEWLSQFSSHGIYGASVLDDCPVENARLIVPGFTHAETAAIMERRGLGGTLADDTGEKLVYGYTMAETLAGHELPADAARPWLQMSGRGFRFRAAIEALQKEGL